jgi:hypothetical protein
VDRIKHQINQVVNGRRYSTEKAELLAESYGTGSGAHLYKSLKGNYFMAYSTIWENSHDSIVPITYDEARIRYEEMVTLASYEQSFNIVPEEA